MFDCAERNRFGRDTKRLIFQNGFFSVEFNVWKFPKMRVHDFCRALSHEELFISFKDKRHEAPFGWLASFFQVRKFFDSIFLARDTNLFQRTFKTFC